MESSFEFDPCRPDVWTWLQAWYVKHCEDDWCTTWTEEGSFHAARGPTNLGEAVDDFRVWATTC